MLMIHIDVALVNIVELLYQTRSEILKKYRNCEILISINEIDDHLPEVYANEPLLFTAFINLVENGVKFSPDHTIFIRIVLSENQVIIKFQNKTENVSEFELENIFDPFIRGSNSKNTKGHGVGLSLTRRIIQLHKGNLIASLVSPDLIVFDLRLPKSNFYTSVSLSSK